MRAERRHVRSVRRLSIGLALAGVALALVLAMAGARAGAALGVERPSVGELIGACRSLAVAASVPVFAALVVLSVATTSLLLAGRATAAVLAANRAARRICDACVEQDVAGVSVTVVADPTVRAFCVGLGSPRIVLSSGAIEHLRPAELAAVVAHEAEHVRRRDPLRVAVLSIVADAAFFVPAVRRLAERHATLAEIVADDAAATVAGRPALARALLAFANTTSEPLTVGIDPQRVDALLGRSSRAVVSLGAMLASLVSLVLLGALTGATGTAQEGARTCALVVVGIVLLAAVAAFVVTRRRASPRAC